MIKFNKIIALWENPFKPLQNEIHRITMEELSRHNGRVTPKQARSILGQNEKAIQRLFVDVGVNGLEWKSDIVDELILTKRYGKTPSTKLLELFRTSRSAEKRTAYPNLVYSNRQHLQKENIENPVFGMDILIRPTTSFHRRGPQTPSINYGRTQLVLFIHLHPNKNGIGYDSKKTMFRAGVGSFGEACGIPQRLTKALSQQREMFMDLLNSNSHELLVQSILEIYQDAIHRTIYAGV